MKKIALIPSYEPNEKLIKIIDELNQNGFEIVLVNDGSDNRFDSIFDTCKEKCTYLTYSENKGKGYALKTGLQYIQENFKNDVVVTMDSDGQHTIKDAKNLIEMAKKRENTIFLGKRLRTGNIPFKSRIGNVATRLMYRLSTGIDIYDTQTGLRAFQTNLIPFLLTVKGNRFEYEMNMLLDAPRNGIALEESVIETIYEENNTGTHFHPIKDSYLVYQQIIKFISSSFASFIIDYLFYCLGTVIFKSIVIANIVARIISSICNYTMNKKIVFKDDRKVGKSILKYYGLAVFILLVNTSFLYLFVSVLGFNKFLMKLLIEIGLSIVSYIVQRRFVF